MSDQKLSDNLPPISETELSDQEVLVEIASLKKKLSDKIIILGHHYQKDEIIAFADVSGDSLELSKVAAKSTQPYIIFCGVHFMAETADILKAPHQKVILPDLTAGCSMADMANIFEVETAWQFINSATDKKIIPITYINCAATLKDFVGKNEGSICTSSNAKKVISWALTKGEKLLFFPDQHLGRNTAYELGISLDEMVIYDPQKENGGLTKEDIKKAKVILWYGYCSVHQGFSVEQIQKIRRDDPEMKIIVHPECDFSVVRNSDLNGSTSYILNTINSAPLGSKWAVGTEINLVERLAKQHPDKKIISLSPAQCLCTTMYRIRPRWLLNVLRAIEKDRPINIISVPKDIAKNAIIALERMFSVGA